MSALRGRVVVALAVAAVLAIVTGACGGNDGDRESASSKKAAAAAEADAKVGAASADADVDADAAASSTVKPRSGATRTDSKGDAAPIPGSTGEGASPATTNPPISTDALKNDYIFGSPAHRSPGDPRPPNCLFKVGEACRFRVHGTYGLKSQDVASIHVGAYDDGASEAAFSVSLPNARKGGSQWFVDKFFYQARPGTKYTEVLVKLIDSKGNVLATGQPTRFDIQA